ncbi:hypothetical protein Ddye_009546 [Dipteronia dyeriana]|uniref:Uncharacterized protein n=1 Tax=Dipteronia dyeriana TaxID=168575 RepID=A0AAD9XBL9_9ROSI|nr:hypothetical protein Ddye_009546 [Dipteronia dyeriana]
MIHLKSIGNYGVHYCIKKPVSDGTPLKKRWIHLQNGDKMNVEYRKFRDVGISLDMMDMYDQMDMYDKMFKGSTAVDNCVMIPSSTILLEEIVGDLEHDQQTIDMENKEASQGQGIGNRNAEERFQRFSETVSRYFDVMLDILYEMAKVMIKSLDPEFMSTPQEILNDSRYMPHIKGCVGAIDGVYV